MSENQRIQHSSQGDEIVIRPSREMLKGQIIIQSIWVILACGLAAWSGSSILAYFGQGEIIGPAKLLDRFDLSSRAFFAAMVGWCVCLVWFGLGGLFEIVKVSVRKDRFIMRTDALTVRKSVFLTREIILNTYEPFALRLWAGEGTLEAKVKSSWRTLTEYGTVADRKWLLKMLQDRYRAPSDLPLTEATKERLGTYIVERTPEGRVKIESSMASTIGCAGIAGVLCVAFCVSAILSVAKGSGGGVILLIFAFGIALGGLSALNRRTVEASRGRLRVQWSSPAGRIASRFLSKDNFFLKYEFGEGAYSREAGILKVKTSHFGKNKTPKHTLVLLHDTEPEDLVLNVPGQGSEETTKQMLLILAESTGFPTA